MPEPTSSSATATDGWSLVIEPRKGWLDFRFAELWRCRDLITIFVWRDFVAFYKQTALGPLWHLLQPLLTTLTFTLIFGRVAGLPTDGVPGFLFYMSGNVLWAYFAASITKTASTFVANTHLYGKVYFHRMDIPVSTVLSNLIALGIQLLLLTGVYVAYVIGGSTARPNAWLLAFPLLVLIMGGFGLGFGIMASALTTRYRDLVQLVGFGVQLWMYATPVIYPVSAIPEQYRWITLVNPLSPLIETFRYGLLGSGTVVPWHLGYSFGVMVVVLLVGVTLFNRVEQTFMDTV